MNRASMLRLAALVIIGLGSALLIAALLLSTYTVGKIEKIPLNIDQTLVASGTGTALDPASLSAGPGAKFVVDQNVPLVSQQAETVETPANAEVVTLQVGTSARLLVDTSVTGGVKAGDVSGQNTNRVVISASSGRGRW